MLTDAVFAHLIVQTRFCKYYIKLNRDDWRLSMQGPNSNSWEAVIEHVEYLEKWFLKVLSGTF